MEHSTNQNSKSKRPLIIALVGLAVLIAVGVGIYALVFNTPSVKVAKGFTNTASVLEQQAAEMSSQMPLVSYFDDLLEEHYAFNIDVSDVNVAFYTDFKNQAMRTDFQLYNSNQILVLTPDYFSIQSDLVADVYGLSMNTLISDLNHCSYLDMELPLTDEDFQFIFDVERHQSAAEAMQSVVSKQLLSLVDGITIEEADDETVELNGELQALDTYCVSVDKDALEAVLYGISEDMYNNQEIVSYWESYFKLYEAYMMLDGYPTDITFDMCIEEYNRNVALFMEEYAHIEAATFLVSLYDNMVVQIKVEAENGTMVGKLASTEDIWENCSLEVDSNGFVNSLSLHSELYGGVFQCALNVDGESYAMMYDTQSTNDNVTLYADGEELTFSVDASQADELTISKNVIGDLNMEIYSQKVQLDADWFAQDETLVNILLLEEADLDAIAAEAMSNR